MNSQKNTAKVEEDVSMFDDEKTDNRNEEEEQVHAHKMEIIQSLLRSFDLDQCTEYYRSLYKTEHTVDPKELSLDSEMAGLKVKSHLESLMGTDVIKLNDRQYMISLQNKLMQEYETNMDKQEELRSEREKRRQRRLYIEGLQDLPNIDAVEHPKSKTNKPSMQSKPTIKIIEEKDYINGEIGRSPNPARKRLTESQRAKVRLSAVENDVADKSEPSHTENKHPDDPDIEDNSTRAILMRKLRKEKTVKGLYKTADLVLAAPVTDLVTHFS